MDKLQKLELIDKIARELEDLKNSQVSLIKKLGQLETDNINLGSTLLEKKLPALHEEVDASVIIVTELVEEFAIYRGKFFVDNKLETLMDPTA